MMRWRNQQQKDRETRFELIKSNVNDVESEFNQIGHLDVEVDEFYRIMRIIRYKLDFWRKKLDESGEAYDIQEIQYRLNDMLKEATGHLCGCIGNNNITHSRIRAMALLKDIPLILDPVTEGSSLVREVEMIARPKELEEIARLLVSRDSNPSSPLSVFPILGMPGSGKTSLVYLLFNHQLVKQHFDCRIWIRWEHICGIRGAQQILRVIKNTFYHYQREFGVVAPSEDDKKYLLIDLDAKYMIVVEDLSNEGDKKWFDLLQPLLSAFATRKFGTKIIVTSNSTSLESHVLLQFPLAKGAPFPLRPLYFDDTLAFFQSIAFRNLAEEDRTPHLNDTAVAIFNKCAIDLGVSRIIANILSSQPPPRWQYLNEVLSNMPNPVKYIHSILDLMQQSQFFNYFSMLPLDYEFSKIELYQLWDAFSDYEDSTETVDSLLGHEYLFQCSRRDKSGVIRYYKVQGLVHEVMKLSPSYKYNVVEDPTKDVYSSIIQHVRLIVDSYWKPPSWLLNAYHLRSLLFSPGKSCETITNCDLDEILKSHRWLKALDLAIVNCRNFMDSITKLELKYLRLGVSPETLPECITNMKFLQTLDLRHSRVQELPTGFHKLCLLKHLYIGDKLIDLPPRFGELTELETLDVFIVGPNNGLDVLANFTHLARNLKIRYRKGREVHKIQEDATFLQDKKLQELLLEWPSSNAESGVEENHLKKDAMESELLQLPSTLKILTVRNWKGEKFPPWAINHFSSLLNNLVSIHIADCSRCKHLPSFSKLGCLKYLELWGLIALEWIEVTNDNSLVSAETPFLPSLERLSLLNLPQLKGWSRMENQHSSCSTLPVLSDLRLSSCPKLIALPLMPKLQSLEANNCQVGFLQQFLSANASSVSSSSASSAQPILQNLRSMNLTNMSIPECIECLSTLEELSLCWLHNLRYLPESIGRLIQLRRLVIRYVPNLVELPKSLAGLFSLEHMEIRYCPRLKQVPEYFSDLKSLQRLEIKECVNLERRCQQNGEDRHLILHLPEVSLG